ncbi:pyridoxamine 5'-phosphate oxidase family protein [Desulfoscipio sp. XC116]|uniref:pyridoxamine 5'-phosphate oxidase family protein n=1 Tax=Desulfoscipio sp. XC116 TaxID=3144975 RepID=UPI00325AF8F1
MPKLAGDVKDLFIKTAIYPVATASKDGIPNVVPIHFVKVYDEDTILLVDNFMDKSLKNLRENPQLSICVWDMDKKQAYQIKGKATIVSSGKPFDEAVNWVKKGAPQLAPKSAILMQVTSIYNCQPGPDLGKEL